MGHARLQPSIEQARAQCRPTAGQPAARPVAGPRPAGRAPVQAGQVGGRRAQSAAKALELRGAQLAALRHQRHDEHVQQQRLRLRARARRRCGQRSRARRLTSGAPGRRERAAPARKAPQRRGFLKELQEGHAPRCREAGLCSLCGTVRMLRV